VSGVTREGGGLIVCGGTGYGIFMLASLRRILGFFHGRIHTIAINHFVRVGRIGLSLHPVSFRCWTHRWYAGESPERERRISASFDQHRFQRGGSCVLFYWSLHRVTEVFLNVVVSVDLPGTVVLRALSCPSGVTWQNQHSPLAVTIQRPFMSGRSGLSECSKRRSRRVFWKDRKSWCAPAGRCDWSSLEKDCAMTTIALIC